ncbi:unnamed protein product [Microthlaspi erraticum]|uniref:Exonuclease domain-containing protein n=1 Tax=Microthlaspi erraticum TaxID=1685480 RepID=A0A6D2JVW8_9BRAS|nr:unnamed protein product [Microthlaspi erraticum]
MSQFCRLRIFSKWLTRNVSTITTTRFGSLQQRIAQEKDLSKLLTVIVSDLETTGLPTVKQRVVEIAAKDQAGGENSTFQSLINPGFSISKRRIHGIRNDMVYRKDVPRMEEMIPEFLGYLESRKKPGGYVMLVAHNGKTFDFKFLINEFSRCSFEFPHDLLLLDTLPLAREYIKSLESDVKPKASLSALGDYYNFLREGEAHRALPDVLLLSKVFPRLTTGLNLSLADLVLRSHTASDLIAAMAKNKKKTQTKFLEL